MVNVRAIRLGSLRGLGWQVDRAFDALGGGTVKRGIQTLERRLGITRAGEVAIVGAVVLWITARIVAGTAIYAIAYGALLFVVLGYVIAPRRLKLTGERAGLFPRAQEGDRLDVEVRLRAKRGVSTFVLEERVPERLGTSVRVPVTSLRANSEVAHNYTVRAAKRGVYQVGPLLAVTGDPLGLTQHETVVAPAYELLVHPRVEQVQDRPLTRQYEDPPIRPPVSKPWPSGLEFYGMREYRPGDDLRRIVWRATARTGRVMVREAEQGITDHITIILDTDRLAHSRDAGGASESFETGVRAAASLGVRHLRDGYEVRLEGNTGPLSRPLRGQGMQMMLLDALTRVEPSRERLSKLIMRLIATPRRDAHNVLITPKLTQHEAAQLRILLNTGVSILVVALAFEENENDTAATAASLGCQVVEVHPNDDLATALHGAVGAGTR